MRARAAPRAPHTRPVSLDGICQALSPPLAGPRNLPPPRHLSPRAAPDGGGSVGPKHGSGGSGTKRSSSAAGESSEMAGECQAHEWVRFWVSGRKLHAHSRLQKGPPSSTPARFNLFQPALWASHALRGGAERSWGRWSSMGETPPPALGSHKGVKGCCAKRNFSIE